MPVEKREEGRQDRQCRWCGVYESTRPITTHHVWPRSVRPDLIDDPMNLLALCSECHERTEQDMSFMRLLQEMYYKHP